MAGASVAIRRGELAFELEGHDEVVRTLGEAAGRMEHAAPMYDLIGAMLVTSTQDRFERETDPTGNPWPMSIRVQLEGGRTLTDSGHLRNSLTHEADDEGVAVGTNVAYALIHQLGGVIRARAGKALHFFVGGAEVFVRQVTIPARPFLGLDDADDKAMLEIAGDYVLEPFGGGSNAAG